MTGRSFGWIAVFSLALLPLQARAAFHLMQIEQVISGVANDPTAQAVQLRMRAAGQNFVSSARIYARDAAGGNPVLLEDMTTQVANSQAGRRILLATPSFANYTNIPLVADFIMDPIPGAYRAAGSLTFEDDFGTVYWRLSWGGAAYTGSGAVSPGVNDADGNASPPVAGSLPLITLQSLQFTGAASALSTNNEAQYALTVGAATFINNAGTSFTLVAPVGQPVTALSPGARAALALALGALALAAVRRLRSA